MASFSKKGICADVFQLIRLPIVNVLRPNRCEDTAEVSLAALHPEYEIKFRTISRLR